MKQIFSSNGIFKTELTIIPPEEIYDNECRLWRQVERTNFQVYKTSQCCMRYEIEKGDKEHVLNLQADVYTAAKDFWSGKVSREQYEHTLQKWSVAAKIYEAALAKEEHACEDVYYIETADNTERGCQAFYRTFTSSSQCEQPCKIGESLVIKIW